MKFLFITRKKKKNQAYTFVLPLFLQDQITKSALTSQPRQID